MGRAEKRAIARAQKQRSAALMAGHSRQETIERLYRNGITAEDVRGEFDRGRETGFREAAEPMIKTCYAAVGIAMHRNLHLDQDQLIEALRAVDDMMVFALNHQELVDQLLDETGIELALDEPFGRVRKKPD